LAGRRFNAIWFRRTDTLPTRVRLAYRPMIDEYQGQRRVTLGVEHRG
jgi:single-stranded-DNA-specific exonuclease